MTFRSSLRRRSLPAKPGREAGGSRRSLAKRLWALACAVVVCAAAFPAGVQAQDSGQAAGAAPEIRVGWFFGSDDQSSFARYSREYLQAVAQYTGWKYTYKSGTFEQCLKWCEDGEVDILPYTMKTAGREQVMDYSAKSAGVEEIDLVTRSDNDAFTFDDYSSFNGMTVAIMSGDANYEDLKKFIADHDLQVKPLMCPDYNSMFRAVDTGGADAFLSGDYQGRGSYKLLARISDKPFYFLTTKKNPQLIGQLNEAMDFIDINYPDFQSDLLARYGNYRNQLTELSAAEKTFLAGDPQVGAFIRTDRNPLLYSENGSDFKGIVPEMLGLVSKKSGLSFSCQPFSAESMFQKNAVIVCPYDYGWADQYGIKLTAPSMTTAVVRISGSSGRLGKVARIKDDYLTYDYYNSLPDRTDIVDYPDLIACVEAVDDGRADCVYLSSYEAEYLSQIPKYKHLTFQTLTDTSQSISFGVTRDSDPALFTLLAKYMGSIDRDDIRQIEAEHTIGAYGGSWTDIFYDSPLASVFISCILFVALIGMIMMTLLYRKKSRQEARASEAKSEFLSRMSHDMRTPMNGIIGMSHIAREQDNPPKTAECLEKIDTSSRFLMSLLNDILDMARIENGKTELNPEPYGPQEFRHYIDSVIRPLCDDRKLTFTMDTQAPGDLVPVIDKLRANQIILNLLSNSVKFTPKGGSIRLWVYGTPAGEGRMALEAGVADTGIGMSEEFQKVMFEPFAQETRNDLAENRGSGLGLAIVNRMVTMMGGTIRVDSKISQGTTIVVSAEFECAPADVSHDTAPEHAAEDGYPDLAGRRILLCEDHPLNQEIAVALLTKQDMLVEIAANGRIGVDMFTASAPGYYDAILMDIHMDQLDGYGAAREIRACGRPDAASVPIIAMTADAFDADIARCAGAGMNGHVAKPVDPALLYDTLQASVLPRP